MAQHVGILGLYLYFPPYVVRPGLRAAAVQMLRPADHCQSGASAGEPGPKQQQPHTGAHGGTPGLTPSEAGSLSWVCGAPFPRSRGRADWAAVPLHRRPQVSQEELEVADGVPGGRGCPAAR